MKVARPYFLALPATLVVALVVRVLVVAVLPDADMDSYGHFAAARKLVESPAQLAAHWVWLPGWHFILALFIELRAGFYGARLFNACLAAVGPLVLYRLLAERSPLRGSHLGSLALEYERSPLRGSHLGSLALEYERSLRAAVFAALAWALAPLSSIVATSAQSETLFALLLVCACFAVSRGRGVPGGVLLAAACLLRYEAWAAVAGLAVVFVPLPRSRGGSGALDRERRRATAIAVSIAGATIVAWCILRAGADGRWLAFVGETSRFVGGIEKSRGPASIFLYTLVVPAKVFGPVSLVALLGIRRAARQAPELARVSLAILGFLTLTCLLGGSLGLDRHFASLVPFACVAIGFGLDRLFDSSARLARGAIVSLVAMSAVHLVVFVAMTRTRWAAERGAAAWIDAHPPSPDIHVVCTDMALELALNLPARRFVRELPSAGPALVVGWESQLGALANEGTLMGRWAQGGSTGAAIVVRAVDPDRALPRASTASKIATGTN
jgi:hypothetical protein